MDNATKRELKKQDQFVSMTEHGLKWASQNRRSAITTSAILLLVILAAVGGFTFYSHRSEQASIALGAAMQTYQAPIANSGQLPPAGVKVYNNAAERAAAANSAFQDVANHYGMTADGKMAKYFVGLTFMDEGQNKSAEETLKSVAGSMNGDVAALAKLALAQLYRQTGRDADAATLYQELTKADASTVPAGLAQIKLAEMYEAEGKAEEAKKIYAQLKDKDKDDKGKPGPIGSLAAEKLNPGAAQGPGL